MRRVLAVCVAACGVLIVVWPWLYGRSPPTGRKGPRRACCTRYRTRRCTWHVPHPARVSLRSRYQPVAYWR